MIQTLSLSPIITSTMNKKRPRSLPASKTPPPPPSTPPPPTTTGKHPSLLSTKTKRPLFFSPPQQWVPLDLPKSELNLPLTFPTGQTFRWHLTSPDTYTGVIATHLISLRQHPNNIFYTVHNGGDERQAEVSLREFLNVGVSLREMWKGFGDVDERFRELGECLVGARVLRQEPVECLMQFLCTSNNNIGRIGKMVGFLSELGKWVGSVDGVEFYEFPTLERLGEVDEEEWRAAGFGYRAKYIVGTVKALQSKPGGGAAWLNSLRELDLHEVVNALCMFPGVGPKVAACVALFSLDQHNAVPVDVHVWRLATQYLIPELAGARLSPKLCSRVAEAFVTKYGKYAGWAQTLLFIAELPSQKALLPPHLGTVKIIKTSQRTNCEPDLDSMVEKGL